MQFVYPSFLYALGLIAVPVIIHLFNLVRPKRVVFSSIRFLSAVELKTSSKLKLKQLLVLLARIFTVAFLVLIFAQPYLSPEGGTDLGNRPLVSIYIDNSYSMSALKDNEELFSTAMKQVDQIIRTYPENTRFQLVDNSLSPQSLYLHGEQKTLDMLTEVSYSEYSRSAKEIYNRQKSVLSETEAETKHILWFTDAQKSTLGSLDQIEKDTSFTHFLFALNDDAVPNAYVDSVYLENPFIRASEMHTLKVRVRNSGNAPLDEVAVMLLLNNAESGRAVVSLAPRASETVELNVVPADTGQLEAVVKLDDNALEFDNTHYLTLEVSSPIRILSISDSTKSGLERLYTNESLFRFTHFNVNAIDYDQLASQEVIVLEGLRTIPPSLQATLEQQGSSLTTIVIPRADSDAESYQRFLASYGVATRLREGFKEQLQAPKAVNPLLKGVFTKIDERMDLPYFTPSFSVSGFRTALLSGTSGSPFLVNAGKDQNLYVFTSPFGADRSNFMKHSFLVPVMYRLAMLGTGANRNIQYTLDQEVKEVRLPQQADNELFTLQSGEMAITPDQKRRGGELLLSIDASSMSPGFYHLMSNGKQRKTIALNRTAEEGNLEALSEEERAGFSDAKIAPDMAPTELLSGFNYGTPLWKYCVIGALFFLLIEIALIRFWKV